jgi:membrane protease YdiL (CAAX protease family)
MLGLDGEEAQALTDRLGTDETLSIVILIVVLTISGPLQEEFLFRGYVFRALRNRQGV